MPQQQAFVFIKPHASGSQKTRTLVAKMLKDNGITIVEEGQKTAKEIDENQYVDIHYYAIASKATLLKPNQLNVPADKFEEKFGIGWQAALDAGKVFNAKDACSELQTDAEGLNKIWAACKKAKKMIKFGGGFYCGEVKPGMYVFNGFFMSMRSTYVVGNGVYYFNVQWDEDRLSWGDFRGKVLGPTDPTEAPPTSIRGTIFAQWESLGLPACPNVGDNGVHASASPFEAFCERKNWLGVKTSEDAFGRQLLDAGISEVTVDEWTKDPSVTDPNSKKGKGSLWDQLEDTDTSECLRLCLPGFATAAPEEESSCCSSKSTATAAPSSAFCLKSCIVGLAVGALAGLLISRNTN